MLRRGTSIHSEHASQSFASVKPMFSDMISYMKSCILTRVRKLCREVVHRFDYHYGKFDDTHGVIC